MDPISDALSISFLLNVTNLEVSINESRDKHGNSFVWTYTWASGAIVLGLEFMKKNKGVEGHMHITYLYFGEGLT